MDREKTDKGRRIDVALFDVAINHMSPYITNYVRSGKLPVRDGSGHSERVPYQAFNTQDGSVLIGANTDQMWRNLWKAMGLDELGCDPRYSTIQGRVQNRQELVMALEKETQKYKSRELESMLMSAKVPCGKIRNIDEVIEESFVTARGLLEDINYPNIGWVKTVRMPIFFDGKPFDTRIKAPLLGEHTTEVLREVGYGDEAIQELIDKGVALQYKL
jgi:formyl-CoA transferase/CoA:oxalate CoA-transferase